MTDYQEDRTIKRVLTAAIALPLLILFILKANLVMFAGLMALLSCLGLFEFYSMALPGRKAECGLASAAGAVLPLILLHGDRYLLLTACLTLMVLLFGIIFLFRIGDIKKVATEAALMFMGLLYVPLLLGHFVLLRERPFGISWIFLILVIVMCGDTFAYYVGSSFGRHKLYPAVSPNKSVEGSLGGVAGSIAGALVMKFAFFPELGFGACVAAALLLGVFGQLGDLFESLLKRSFGVKDSGNMIPGHGGILDRLDSLLFAAPAAFYYVLVISAGS